MNRIAILDVRTLDAWLPATMPIVIEFIHKVLPVNVRPLIMLVLLSLFASTACAQTEYPVAVGQIHPDFKLPSVTDGQPISLSDLRGKKVLLLHFASW